MTTAQDGGKVVSLMHRPPLPRGNTPGTVKYRCNERQYNEMFRIAKLFLGPFPFPYLMCVKTFHFNKFRTFSITN